MGDALDFRANLDEAALMAYINKLSHDGADLMVKVWGSASRGIGGLVAPHALQATMHNVIAPTTGNASNQAMQCGKISDQLVHTYKFQLFAGVVDTIPCFLRVHAQIYLELSDYRRLAEAVLEILRSTDDAAQDLTPPLNSMVAPAPLGAAIAEQ